MKSTQLLLSLAKALTPESRREWLSAMQHELPHIPVGERFDFAIGCLTTSIQQRIKTMTQFPPLRIVPGLIGAALLIVLCIGNGVRLISDAPVLGAFLLGAGALWIAVYAVVSAQERHRLASLAVAGIALYAALGILSLIGANAFSENAEMFTALSVEGIVLFVIVLIVSRIQFFWALAKEPN